MILNRRIIWKNDAKIDDNNAYDWFSFKFIDSQLFSDVGNNIQNGIAW